MNFEQFLDTYNIVNFAWEIFKGISPTVIALLTIWINTIIGKRKSEKEAFSNEIKDLQLKVSNLAFYAVETGEYLLEAIQNSKNNEESRVMLNEFEHKNKQMLKEAKKFMFYTSVREERYNKKEILFEDTCEKISHYSYELLDILKWYNEQALKTSIEDFDYLCDEVQKRIIISTEKIENALLYYCRNLNNDKK